MKRLALSLALMCAVALPTLAQAAPSGPTPKPPVPKPLQSSAVNTSRSNIKNNLVIDQGPDGKLRCVSNGKPCTEAQVKALEVTTGKPPWGALSLAKDGSLMCGKKPCTAAHLPALKRAVGTKGISGS
jgi:hypothetical protein